MPHALHTHTQTHRHTNTRFGNPATLCVHGLDLQLMKAYCEKKAVDLTSIR